MRSIKCTNRSLQWLIQTTITINKCINNTICTSTYLSLPYNTLIHSLTLRSFVSCIYFSYTRTYKYYTNWIYFRIDNFTMCVRVCVCVCPLLIGFVYRFSSICVVHVVWSIPFVSISSACILFFCLYFAKSLVCTKPRTKSMPIYYWINFHWSSFYTLLHINAITIINHNIIQFRHREFLLNQLFIAISVHTHTRTFF